MPSASSPLRSAHGGCVTSMGWAPPPIRVSPCDWASSVVPTATQQKKNASFLVAQGKARTPSDFFICLCSRFFLTSCVVTLL